MTACRGSAAEATTIRSASPGAFAATSTAPFVPSNESALVALQPRFGSPEPRSAAARSSVAVSQTASRATMSTVRMFDSRGGVP